MTWSPSLITSDPNHSINSCTNHHCRVYCQIWQMQTPCLYRHPFIPDSRLIPRVSSQSFLEFVMRLSFTVVCERGMGDTRTSACDAVKWSGTFDWNKLLSFTHSRYDRLPQRMDNVLGPDGTDNKQHLSTLTLNTKNSSSNAIPCRLQWDL